MKGPVRDLVDALVHRAHLDRGLISEARVLPLLDERRRALRAACNDSYARMALADEAEFARLRDMIAVPETWLFRYPTSFDLLRERLRAAGATQFRALSLACATGAEPYSMAAAALAAGVPPGAVRVLAIDPSPDAIALAQRGAFARMAAREGVPAWAETWFETRDDTVHACEALRQCIEWSCIAAPDGLIGLAHGEFDAIFCRNMAIYLGERARRTIGMLLNGLLAPHGLLFLGHAEPPGILGLADRFTPLEPRASFAFARAPIGSSAEAAATPASAPSPATERAPTRRSAPAHRHAGHRAASRNASGNAGQAIPTLEAVRTAANAGHAERAIQLGRARLDEGDRCTELLLLLGSSYAALGQHQPAEELLRQVAYLEPDHVEALLQLAALAERRGDAALADRYRTRAARTPPAEAPRGVT